MKGRCTYEQDINKIRRWKVAFVFQWTPIERGIGLFHKKRRGKNPEVTFTVDAGDVVEIPEDFEKTMLKRKYEEAKSSERYEFHKRLYSEQKMSCWRLFALIELGLIVSVIMLALR